MNMRITHAIISGKEKAPEDYTAQEVRNVVIHVNGIEVPAELLAYADDDVGEVGRYTVDEFGNPTKDVEILRGDVQIMLRSKGRIKDMLHEAANSKTG
jgi:hypothetical protein